MEISAFLAEQGLTAEEIAALVGNEKSAKAMTAALSKYTEGVTLSTKAQTDLQAAEAAKRDAEEFYETKVTPALANVDKKVATANSEAARYKAYLQSLKDQGYDVPADLLTAPTTTTTTPTTTTGNFVSREDFQKEFSTAAPTMVALMSLSNEYQDLYGAPYLAGETDFAEARKARKPLREFVREKYKLEEKKLAKAAAADQARVDAIVKEKVDAERAKLVAQYGSNPETRSPVASKFDKIEKSREASGKDSWKTEAGRKAARSSRLSRFENIQLQ